MSNKPHRPISTRMDKIKWLLENQHLWEGYPDEVPRHSTLHKEIVTMMKEAGLVSKSTYWPDLSLDTLIMEARKLRREGTCHEK